MSWAEIKEILLAKISPYSDSYKKRLNFEISEVEKQGAELYWVGLVESGKKFKSNPNRLLMPFLLSMVDQDPFDDRKTPILNSIRASSVNAYREKYGYLPEDFVKDTDMPDIDIDSLPESRDPLKEYVIKKYSADINDAYGSVCSVGTWQTYKFKSALADVAVALEAMTRQEIQAFTTDMPVEVDDLRENGKSICKGRIITEKGEIECGVLHDAAVCPSCNSPDTEAPTLGKLLAEDQETDNFKDGPLRTLYKEHPEVVQYATQLVGRIRNMGMHAGALIITDRPLYGNIPLSKSSSKGFWTSVWTEGRATQLSKFGYIKWDLLGLKTLKYIYRASQLIKENRGITFGDNFEGLEYNDPELRHAGFYFDVRGVKHFIDMDDYHALDLANKQMTDAVFQFDTDLAKQILLNGAKNFEDLMLLSAMGHPGPMQSIPEAVENRDDVSQSWKKTLHPDMLKILESTYGILCYQEQLQAAWQIMAGFTSPEAQDARKAVAKKWTHKLKPIKQKWLSGASKKMGEVQADQWWSKMETFGRYAFNKSHSVAYTLMAFRCLWLKAHFAPEYWAAVMSDCHPDKLIRYMGVARTEDWNTTDITYCGTINPEVRARKVTFGTLDVNNLQNDFSVSGDVVNVGLKGIKGIGDRAAEIFSGKGNYKTLEEFLNGENPDHTFSQRRSKTVLERLIKLDSFKMFEGHENSKSLWVYYQYHYCSGVKELKDDINIKLLKLDGWDEKTIRAERQRLEAEYRVSYPKRNKIPPKISNWKPIPKPTLENINKVVPENFSLAERLGFQKEYIGYYVDNPLEMFKISGHGTIAAAKERASYGRNAYLEALVEKYVPSKTKTGKDFGKLYVTDGLSSCIVFIWARELAMQDKYAFESGTGVFIPVDYDSVKKLFCLSRGESILRLSPI